MTAGSLERTIVVVGLVLTAASLAWRSVPVTAGVGVGALAMWLNFRWLRRIVARALAEAAAAAEEAEGRGRGVVAARLAVEFVLKFGALVALVYLLVRRTGVDPIGLLVGLSTVFIATVVEFVRNPSARE
ncbi:MAG TPA: ATP synthase subunit I [Thermodesulfobacteriota bacterium]